MTTKTDAQSSATMDLMTDQASSLGADLIVNNYEYLCPIPAKVGSGFIKLSDFQNETSVLEISCILSQKLKLSLKRPGSTLVRLIFNLESEFRYRSSRGPLKLLNRLETVLHKLADDGKSELILPSNIPISIYIIDLYDNMFFERTRDTFEKESESFTAFLDELSGGDEILSKTSFTLNLRSLISSYAKNSYTGSMRFIFQEAKVNEIILERVKQFIDDRQGIRKTLLRKSTVKGIEHAAGWIVSNLDTKMSIKALAKNVGLSQQTLQQGFRHQFGCSVNDFIVTSRLNKAVGLLENTPLNISEITYEIGLSSKSYFAKVFQERFGLTPNEYRKLKQGQRGNQDPENG